MITVSELTIYPVKSMAGISLQSSQLDSMGLQYDRRWMVVSPEGKFITQRSHPQLALIQPKLNNGQLSMSSFGLDDHIVPAANEDSPSMTVHIWDDVVQAKHLSKETDAWLEQTVGEPCHLVFIVDDEVRQCDTTYAREGDRTGFSDGFPLLLISEASLDDINNKLDNPVPMKRFRPNLVVTGCEAFAEDSWKEIQVNNVTFHIIKPCSRCIITTVNPDTGIVSGTEPLKTLSEYRKRENKVMFGQNLVHDNSGELSVGDSVKLIKVGASNV